MKYLRPNRRGIRLAAGLALTTAASLTFAACGGGGQSGSPGAEGSASGGGGEPVAVTLITKDNNNPYWISMQKSADAAAAKDGITLTKAAGAKDGDEDGQVKAIEAAVARGDKGILISPNGPGVNSAIENARNSGLYVIALDTVPSPPDTVDGSIATDNFKAGELIGKWMAGTLNGGQATIALLDLFNDKVVTVDTGRDQGFLTGMGIDTKDKNKNGDEDKSGKYTGGNTPSSATSPPKALRTPAKPLWRAAWQRARPSMSSTPSMSRLGLVLPRRCRTRASRRRSFPSTAAAVLASSWSRLAPLGRPPSSTRERWRSLALRRSRRWSTAMVRRGSRKTGPGWTSKMLGLHW
jgi:hypothetical protein